MKKFFQFITWTLTNFIKLLFNRIFYVGVALLIQFFWVLLLIWKLNTYSQIISYITTVGAVLVVLYILNYDMNPTFKLAWIILILTVPIFGVSIYVIFGRSRVAEKMERDYKKIENVTRKYMEESKECREKLEKEDLSIARQSAYIRDYAGYPVWQNTIADYFMVGDDMFPVMIEELNQAKHFIFIEYFIINNGVMWESILEILERKAKEGVDVRLIYDGFGCLTTLPHNYDKKLREKGIKCHVFNRFRPFLNIIQNNRDHRKICVIDGYTGFTGGVNLADEYINQKDRFGHWKDTAVMLRGEAVWNFTAMFLHMWSIVSSESVPEHLENYLPHAYHKKPFESDGFVQPYCDIPLDGEIVGEFVYLNLIQRAKEYVYICTPYLIIDNEMMTALCLAAKSGIDVRIMTPGVPDKKMIFWLTQSFYRSLISAGVKIYEYQPGFLHAKSFVCDDEVGVVGTINMDYRSLYLHFEDGVWLYKNDAVMEIKEDFLGTLAYCREVTKEDCMKQPIGKWIVQNVLSVFAPLL